MTQITNINSTVELFTRKTDFFAKHQNATDEDYKFFLNNEVHNLIEDKATTKEHFHTIITEILEKLLWNK